LILAALSLAVQASWFGGSNDKHDPVYKSWNADELKAWLQVHNVPLPSDSISETDLRKAVKENWNTASAWTYDQYNSAQTSFESLRDTAFDSWDESKLRQFLLEHGVVAPKGPREYLVILAKQKYNAYTSAASSFSSLASASVSSAVYGGKQYQASKSVDSMASHATGAVAQATKEVATKFDETKDYVYSTWDENQMRSWLVQKGLLKSKEQKKKEELLQMMNSAWGKVANPVWEAWSDSYIRHWLVQHHIIKSDSVATRDSLIQYMKTYFYSTSDAVYDSWSDSELKTWLIDHGIIKSDAQVTREKMLKMIQSYYISANDTFWGAWSDSQIRSWLIEHGYLRTDAQVKRDELVKLANEKWSDASTKASAYLTWPDARLRAYLREHGVDEQYLPTSRPGLLQETRIRWLQSQTRAENLLAKIREVINSGIYKAEDTLSYLLTLLSGGWEEAKDRSADAYEKVKEEGAEKQSHLEKKASEMRDRVQEKVGDARETAGEKVKVGGQKLKGEL
jgi:hypothetical protein